MAAALGDFLNAGTRVRRHVTSSGAGREVRSIAHAAATSLTALHKRSRAWLARVCAVPDTSAHALRELLFQASLWLSPGGGVGPLFGGRTHGLPFLPCLPPGLDGRQPLAMARDAMVSAKEGSPQTAVAVSLHGLSGLSIRPARLAQRSGGALASASTVLAASARGHGQQPHPDSQHGPVRLQHVCVSWRGHWKCSVTGVKRAGPPVSVPFSAHQHFFPAHLPPKLSSPSAAASSPRVSPRQALRASMQASGRSTPRRTVSFRRRPGSGRHSARSAASRSPGQLEPEASEEPQPVSPEQAALDSVTSSGGTVIFRKPLPPGHKKQHTPPSSCCAVLPALWHALPHSSGSQYKLQALELQVHAVVTAGRLAPETLLCGSTLVPLDAAAASSVHSVNGVGRSSLVHRDITLPLKAHAPEHVPTTAEVLGGASLADAHQLPAVTAFQPHVAGRVHLSVSAGALEALASDAVVDAASRRVQAAWRSYLQRRWAWQVKQGVRVERVGQADDADGGSATPSSPSLSAASGSVQVYTHTVPQHMPSPPPAAHPAVPPLPLPADVAPASAPPPSTHSPSPPSQATSDDDIGQEEPARPTAQPSPQSDSDAVSSAPAVDVEEVPADARQPGSAADTAAPPVAVEGDSARSPSPASHAASAEPWSDSEESVSAAASPGHANALAQAPGFPSPRRPPAPRAKWTHQLQLYAGETCPKELLRWLGAAPGGCKVTYTFPPVLEASAADHVRSASGDPAAAPRSAVGGDAGVGPWGSGQHTAAAAAKAVLAALQGKPDHLPTLHAPDGTGELWWASQDRSDSSNSLHTFGSGPPPPEDAPPEPVTGLPGVAAAAAAAAVDLLCGGAGQDKCIVLLVEGGEAAAAAPRAARQAAVGVLPSAVLRSLVATAWQRGARASDLSQPMPSQAAPLEQIAAADSLLRQVLAGRRVALPPGSPVVAARRVEVLLQAPFGGAAAPATLPLLLVYRAVFS